jgi:hypothetical protein
MVGGSIYNKKGRHSHVPHTSQWSEEMFDESELCAGENSHIVYIYYSMLLLCKCHEHALEKSLI